MIFNVKKMNYIKSTQMKKYLYIFSWVSLIFVAFYIFYLFIPGQGAPWSRDDGFVLANASNLANGLVFDIVLPQQPVYIIQAILIKIGFNKYIYFRYFYYLLTIISSWIFYTGLIHKKIKYSTAPQLATIATLLVSFTYITPFYQFFLLGLGLYFHGEKIDYSSGKILSALGGIFLGIQAFINAGIAIGMIFLFSFIILFMKNDIKRNLLLIFFFISTILLWTIYTLLLGFNNLLIVPGGHSADLMHLLGRFIFFLKVYTFILIITIFFNLFSLLFRKMDPSIPLYLVITYLIILLLVNTLGIQIDVTHFANKINLIFNENLSIMQIPALSAYLFIFSIFNLFISRLISARDSISINKLVIFEIFNDYKMITLGSVGYLLLFSSYCVGSNVNFFTLFSAFSGPFLGLSVIIIWHSLLSKTSKLQFYANSLIVIWIAVIGYLGLYINIPYQNPLIDERRITINSGPLTGLNETSRYIYSLQELTQLYDKFDCKDKVFISLEYTPLLNFIFQNNFPPLIPSVRPRYFFNESISQVIEKKYPWCILDTTNIPETRVYIKELNGIDFRDGIRRNIIKFSNHSFTIKSPSDEFEDIVFYIRY